MAAMEMQPDPDRWSSDSLVARVGQAVWPGVVAVGISLVAYADWRVVTDTSLGYLYFVPLVVAGMTIRRRVWLLFFVATAAALRESFGPFEHSGWPMVSRNVLVPSMYSLVALLVHRFQYRQQQLADIVDQQRAQLSRDVEEAAALQRLLMPRDLPAVPGWDMSARVWPARVVAGDYYDVLWDDSRHELVVVVADVAGKGPAAAMLMPVVQTTVRRLRSEGVTPGKLAAKLNDVIASLADRPRLISLVYIVCNARTGDFVYVNMGHPPPVIVSPDSKPWRWLSQGGPIAGAVPGATYPVGREQLGIGDTLVLYSDGVSEAANKQGDVLSERGVAEVVSRFHRDGTADVLEDVYEAVEEFRDRSSTRDDMTLVVLRRDPTRQAAAVVSTT